MKNKKLTASFILSAIIHIAFLFFLFYFNFAKPLPDPNTPVLLATLVHTPSRDNTLDTPARGASPLQKGNLESTQKKTSVPKQKTQPIISEQAIVPVEPQETAEPEIETEHTPSGDNAPATPLTKGNYETANTPTENSAEAGESNENENNSAFRIPHSALTTEPTALYMPNIPYPRTAKSAKIEGTAEIAYIINEKGRVISVEILSIPHISFESVIKRAVMSWRFNPATKNGNPVSIKATKTIVFKLD